ncbi:MAG TPA: phosphatase PAP2 family protein, partial [Solirubrobacteraceae bacterium]|nr:phosphatase PAP2 family protein [Solirubrobacteraceae bacterium]
RAAEAFDNARSVIHIEQDLGLFFEPAVHAWASAHAVVIDASSWMYVNSHFVITTVTLAWIYLCRNERFYFVRNMFMVAMAIALIGYVAVPTAPPRFMPEWGFVDSVSDFTHVSINAHSSSISALTNLYAAVPSMHVAFALMIGWTLARLVRSPLARVAWMAYPFMMAFVIIVTANHFILDALLGALTAGASAYGASRLARVRPSVWRFSSVTAPRLTASG